MLSCTSFVVVIQGDSEAAASCLNAQQLHTMHLLQQSQVPYDACCYLLLKCCFYHAAASILSTT